eukprot:89808-Chlamydomonas_euryale.AAC.1
MRVGACEAPHVPQQGGRGHRGAWVHVKPHTCCRGRAFLPASLRFACLLRALCAWAFGRFPATMPEGCARSVH